MIKSLKNYWAVRFSRAEGDRGVAAMEYAIMLFLVSLAVAGFGEEISSAVTGVFEQVLSILT